jgi:hypothetical protein
MPDWIRTNRGAAKISVESGIQPRPQVTEKHCQNCRIRDQAVG